MSPPIFTRGKFSACLLLKQIPGADSLIKQVFGKSQLRAVATLLKRTNDRLLVKFTAKAAALALLLAVTACGIPIEIERPSPDIIRGPSPDIVPGTNPATEEAEPISHEQRQGVFPGLSAYPYDTGTETGVELRWRNINRPDFLTGVTVVCRNLTLTAACPPDVRLVFTPEEVADFIANATGSYRVRGLTGGSNYSFALLLSSSRGASIAIVEVIHRDSGATRDAVLAGFNLDLDEYADADPLDTDDDNDGVGDATDRCDPDGPFISFFADGDVYVSGMEPAQDYDGDGCRNDEDQDTDNDGVPGTMDLCPYSPRGFTSNSIADSDSDGCQDTSEDRDGGAGTDIDNDGVPSNLDVDDDGDGLIDIGTDAELNNIRHNLAGTSYRDSATATGNSNGCRHYAEGYELITTSCRGYNLVDNITLSGAWTPIGDCAAADCAGNNTLKFSGVFDGKGHSINNLQIRRGDRTAGFGLFGAAAPTAELRNVVLNNVDIMAVTVLDNLDFRVRPEAADYVGALAGFAAGAIVTNNHVQAAVIRGRNNVGGLLGAADHATITANNIVVRDLRGGESNNGATAAGGLVGRADNAAINFNAVRANNLMGRVDVGGLVGRAENAAIRANLVLADRISEARGQIVVGGVSQDIERNGENAGGLAGNAREARLSANLATVGLVSSSDNIGGLVGDGGSVSLSSSYVLAGRLQLAVASAPAVSPTSPYYADGLIGNSARASSSYEATASYWLSNVAYPQRTDMEHERCPPLAVGLHTSPQCTSTDDPFNPLRRQAANSGAGRAIAEDNLKFPTDNNATNTGSIYASWGRAWCNPTTRDLTVNPATGALGGYVALWNFGNSTQYPALNCLPLTPAEQRDLIPAALGGENLDL